MAILLPILFLLGTGLAMAVVQRVRPQFAYAWPVAAGGGLLAWVSALVFRTPTTVQLFTWQPVSLFLTSPGLRLDAISWPFVLALTILAFAVILTNVGGTEAARWSGWAGALALTGVGVLAVTAGNPLTLVLIWIALDIVEFAMVLPRSESEEARRKSAIALFVGLLSATFIIWAEIESRSVGVGLDFEALTSIASGALLLAAGLRLGALAVNTSLLKEASMRRGSGNTLQLVKAAACLVLIVRVAEADIFSAVSVFAILVTLVGLYAATKWALAEDEIEGRPYWFLGVGSLAIAGALRGQAGVALTWGLAGLYGGGALFLFGWRPRGLVTIGFFALINLSGLPFSAARNASNLYAPFDPLFGGFLLVQGILLFGFGRHLLRKGEGSPGVEPWIRLVYPLGLALLPLMHLGSSYWPNSEFNGPAFGAPWWPGAMAIGLAGLLGLLAWQWGKQLTRSLGRAGELVPVEVLAKWARGTYKYFGGLIELLSRVLEGEAGMLWALLLVALLLSLLSQLSAVVGGGG